MPPGTSFASKIVACTPFNARYAAAARPDGPLPMIATLRPVCGFCLEM